MRVCIEGGGGGAIIIKKKECSMVDVINIVAIIWQYLHTVYLFRERAKPI